MCIRDSWNVNESITTLMLNYIALIILSYLVLGPWKMPGQNVGQTKRIPVGLEIPEINGKMCIRDSREIRSQSVFPVEKILCLWQSFSRS